MNGTNEVYIIECSKEYSIIYYEVFFEKKEIKNLLKNMIGMFGNKIDRISIIKANKGANHAKLEIIMEINDISVIREYL